MIADIFLALVGFIIGIYIFMDFKKYFSKVGELFSFSNNLIIKQNNKCYKLVKRPKSCNVKPTTI
jgi:hypothetical protein